MTLNRREFLAGTAGVLSGAPAAIASTGRTKAAPSDFATIRNDAIQQISNGAGRKGSTVGVIAPSLAKNSWR